MNEFMKERLLRRLETLSDERLYQVLDYVEFLESKYAEHKPAPPNVFQRFAEGVEDTLRAGRVTASTVSQTMDLMSKAMGVLSGVAAAGKSVASDVVTAATTSSQPAGNTNQPPKPDSAVEKEKRTP
ncbi:MAG: hypothetical protein ACHQQ3_03335 [Gemmatimonadales bacterium]